MFGKLGMTGFESGDFLKSHSKAGGMAAGSCPSGCSNQTRAVKFPGGKPSSLRRDFFVLRLGLRFPPAPALYLQQFIFRLIALA